MPSDYRDDRDGQVPGDAIAGYLDELYRRLTSGMVRASAGRAAQIVEEAENHLREGAAMCVAAGMREHAAQVAAVESFGRARTVARAHRPRASAVLAKLGASACPLLAGYLMLAAAVAGVLVFEDSQLVGIASPPTPVGKPQAPSLFVGFPTGQATLLLIACAAVGAVVLAGYLIARHRWSSRGEAARTMPLPGFFFPVAGVGLALLAAAERKLAALAPLHNLPGGHELIAAGAPAAALLTAGACGLWSLALLAYWTVHHLAHRPAAAVRA